MDQEKSLYEILGGEQKLKQLVDSFYHHMDVSPEAIDIRKMHQQDLTEANQKLFDFLSGWLGGPQLFVEKHGHPRLRARHLPFPIGKLERDQWLFCMAKAMEACEVSDEFGDLFFEAISNLADHMRNKKEAE